MHLQLYSELLASKRCIKIDRLTVAQGLERPQSLPGIGLEPQEFVHPVGIGLSRCGIE